MIEVAIAIRHIHAWWGSYVDIAWLLARVNWSALRYRAPACRHATYNAEAASVSTSGD